MVVAVVVDEVVVVIKEAVVDEAVVVHQRPEVRFHDLSESLFVVITP
jgi:hypothetical protein